jgi:hypothetical protein
VCLRHLLLGLAYLLRDLFIYATFVAGVAYHGVLYGILAAMPRNARGGRADGQRGWAMGATDAGQL